MSSVKFVLGARDKGFDSKGINDMICALQLEMGSTPGEQQRETNVLFMGGPDLTDDDQKELGQNAVNQNWSALFSSFDVTNPTAGPLDIFAAVTDGRISTTVGGGRLWKRDRKSRIVVLFPALQMKLKLTLKGRLFVGEMRGQYHDHGYELARGALLERASTSPGHSPVLSTIGQFPTIMDVRTLAMAFEMAA